MRGRATLAVLVVLTTAACSSTGPSSAPPGSSSTAPAAATTPTAPATDAPSTSPAPASTEPAPPPAPVVDLASPAGIAAELTRVEAAIRTLSPDSPEAAAAGRAQQLAFRALAAHPDWDDVVVAAVDPAVRTAVALTIEARQAVTRHSAGRPPSEPPTTLPAWTIRAPLPTTELLALYREAEGLTGVPWNYLAAINFVETRFGRIDGASPDGAQGPMQFLPSTWAECCTGDIDDPRDAIIGAAVYLRSGGAPTDMIAALNAYNPNAGYVGAVDAYARNLFADERAIVGYHGWEVFVPTAPGTVRLPIGYSATEPIDAAAYIAAHPGDLAP